MAYDIFRCSEGKIEGNYDPENKIVEFGHISSCLTLTVILDSSLMFALHAVAAPNSGAGQKSWAQLKEDLIGRIKKYKKNSCVINVAGALLNWKSDLSGPMQEVDENLVEENEHSQEIEKTLRKWFSGAKVRAESYADGSLYSCTVKEEKLFQIYTFRASDLNNWQQYADDAPSYAAGVINAINNNRYI